MGVGIVIGGAAIGEVEEGIVPATPGADGDGPDMVIIDGQTMRKKSQEPKDQKGEQTKK